MLSSLRKRDTDECALTLSSLLSARRKGALADATSCGEPSAPLSSSTTHVLRRTISCVKAGQVCDQCPDAFTIAAPNAGVNALRNADSLRSTCGSVISPLGQRQGEASAAACASDTPPMLAYAEEAIPSSAKASTPGCGKDTSGGPYRSRTGDTLTEGQALGASVAAPSTS